MLVKCLQIGGDLSITQAHQDWYLLIVAGCLQRVGREPMRVAVIRVYPQRVAGYETCRTSLFNSTSLS